MSAVNPALSLPLKPQLLKGNGESWLVQDGAGFPPSLLKECRQSVSELRIAMLHMDNAGTCMTNCLNRALENTMYKCVGDTLRSKLMDVFSSAASSSSSAIFSEIEELFNSLYTREDWRQDPQIYGQMLCHISLLLTKLKRQYFAVCFNKMADLVHSLLCLKGEEPAAGEVTKLVLKLGLADGLDSPLKSNSSLPSTPWGSPKTRSKAARQDGGATTASSKSQSRPGGGGGGFRILSLFERKTSPEERQSSFYVDIEEDKVGGGGPHMGATESGAGDGSSVYGQQRHQPLAVSSLAGQEEMMDVIKSDQGSNVPRTAGGNNNPSCGIVGDGPLISFEPLSKNRPPSSFSLTVGPPSKLASEEELESVINLLSGNGCPPSSPMQAIPEVPLQGGPMQLIVPQIYRMPSPASDTQIEDFKPLSRPQPHRRSEGCLDLSAMWPSPHQLSPSPNLPWVQVFSASSHGSISECPSPISGYGGRDSASPGYMTPSPSPSYPPSPARIPGTTTPNNNLTVGGGGGGGGGSLANVHGSGRALSPMQQQQHNTWGGGGSYSLGGVIGGANCPSRSSSSDFPARQQGTWPLHGSTSFSSAPGGWTGLQDGSDLSDDSSTEDQFFAVGKDLCHALDSKNGTTDEETEFAASTHPKTSSTWPLPNPHKASELNRGLTPDLLEPPEAYHQQHKPVQMQWSDPMSSRSMWPSGSLDVSQRKASQSMHGFGGIQ